MDAAVESMITELCRSGRLLAEHGSIQHGTTTVFAHSVHVAETSLSLARKLHIQVDETSLLRGALLHDYFLYDWHYKDDRPSLHGLHGFTHPYTALKNAREDFDLNRIEETIILRHMFPLTPIPPTCKEAWVVCLADKYCALSETLVPMVTAILPKKTA